MSQADLRSRKKQTWYRLYFALAAFDLITILLSLLLNHNLIEVHKNALAENEVWVKRTEKLDELVSAAVIANAPGNDIFDTKDITAEKAKLESAASDFNARYNFVLDDVRSVGREDQRRDLEILLSELRTHFDEMISETDLIFSSFAEGNEKFAASRMAMMDKKFVTLSAAADNFRTKVREIQKQQLQDETRRADDMVQWEYAITMIVIMIVSFAVLYGHLLARKIAESDSLIDNQQNQIISSAKLASLGTMAGGIAHEINNPISIIQGNAAHLKKLLSRGQVNEETINSTMDKILKTCERMQGIVKGLRVLSRDGEKDAFEKTSLAELIRESTSFCEARFKSHGVHLNIEWPNESLMAECRRVQLSQVLINLMNNSFDAIENSKNAWIKISTVLTESQIRISVTDSGNGIPESVLEKIFTPFFTTKGVGKGTGLGLSISSGILKEHNGSLEYNKSNTNTEFVLVLPRSMASHEIQDSKSAA